MNWIKEHPPLFSKSERFPVDISRVGRENMRAELGTDDWGGATQYADYAGIVKKHAPDSILEMGVFLGYSSIAMLLGCQAAGKTPRHVGVDLEWNEAGSNEVAKANLKTFFPEREFEIHHADVMPDSPLLDILACHEPFDFVLADSFHTQEGTCRQMEVGWKWLAPGGIMVVDDVKNTSVRAGVDDFFLRLLSSISAVSFPQVFWYDNFTGWCILRKTP